VRLLDLILDYDCNLACDYCTITPTMRERRLEASAIAGEMRRARRDGYEAVSFTGGEPTIRPDLIPLVRRSRDLGFTDRKLQTNGLLLAEPVNLRRAIDAGLTRIHVSVHTHEAAAYEAMVRRAGTFRLLEAALEALVDAPVELATDLILKTDTLPRLSGAVDWLGERGVRAVNLWFVSLTDGNRDNLESLPRMTEAVATIRGAAAKAERWGITLRSLHLPRCLLGGLAPLAHDPGAGDVRVVTPDATFELRQSKITPATKVAACEGCEHEAYCPGVRRDYLEVYGDAEIAAARGTSPSRSPTRRLPVV